MGCASSQQDAELRAFQLAQLQQQKDLKASMIPTTHAGVTEVRWKSVNGVRSVMNQAEVDEMYAKVDAALVRVCACVRVACVLSLTNLPTTTPITTLIIGQSRYQTWRRLEGRLGSKFAAKTCDERENTS